MNRHPSISGKGAFDRGADLLAFVASGILTFFTAQPLFRHTVDFATDYATAEIGTGWDWLVTALWWCACWIGAFGLSLMVIALTLRVGIARLATAFYRY